MQRVEIVIEGHLDKQWTEWLEGITISQLEGDKTTLTGSVKDQSAFYGLIAKLRDLGLKVYSVHIEENS